MLSVVNEKEKRALEAQQTPPPRLQAHGARREHAALPAPCLQVHCQGYRGCTRVQGGHPCPVQERKGVGPPEARAGDAGVGVGAGGRDGVGLRAGKEPWALQEEKGGGER